MPFRMHSQVSKLQYASWPRDKDKQDICIERGSVEFTVSQQEKRIDLFCEGDFLKVASCGFGWERTSQKVLVSAISELHVEWDLQQPSKSGGDVGKFLSFDFDPLEINQVESNDSSTGVRRFKCIHGKQFLLGQLLSTPC